MESESLILTSEGRYLPPFSNYSVGGAIEI